VRRLLRAENRFVIAVTHDPREAIYLGKRIVVMGKSPAGSAAVTFDESFETENRSFVSASTISLEKRLITELQKNR
jgi:NitT/TauT family transport system ATP-binding protein